MDVNADIMRAERLSKDDSRIGALIQCAWDDGYTQEDKTIPRDIQYAISGAHTVLDDETETGRLSREKQAPSFRCDLIIVGYIQNVIIAVAQYLDFGVPECIWKTQRNEVRSLGLLLTKAEYCEILM
jgi:hypothetical protein